MDKAPVGTVLTVPTRGDGRSCDFATQTLGRSVSGGDFYFSGSYPGFWGNNRGQQGTWDLGDIDVPLNRVRIPRVNLSEQGVNAVIGNVYLTRIGPSGDFVVFRVLDIGYNDGQTDYYKIQWLPGGR